MDSRLVQKINISEAASLLETAEVVERVESAGLLVHHLNANGASVVLVQGGDSFVLVK